MASNTGEMESDAACLARALQFGDSMFPIGGFSFSCGLESAIQTCVVVDAVTLHGFVRTAVEQAARGDGVALIHAHRAAEVEDLDALVRIDEQVYARKLSEEMRTMSVRMGKKCTEMGSEIIGPPLPRKWRDCIAASITPGCYPVQAFIVHQYGVAATILGAALRLMKIGHIETQKILYELNGRTEAAYEIAAATRLSDMAGYAPMTEILAAAHANAHVRLFMS
jgi:urease accessory protein